MATTKDDHWREFVCEDCGITVHTLADDSSRACCLVCEFIRTFPDIDEAMKAHLRGSAAKVRTNIR